MRPRCVRVDYRHQGQALGETDAVALLQENLKQEKAALDKLEKAASCLSREHTVALRPIPGPALAPTHRSSRRLFLTHAGQGVAARLVEAKQRVEPGEVGDPLGDARRVARKHQFEMRHAPGLLAMRREQASNHGRVDERAFTQVDEDVGVLASGIERGGKLGRCAHVVLATKANDRDLVGERFEFDTRSRVRRVVIH